MIHPDLLEAKKNAYTELSMGEVTLEAESQEYAACDFTLNGQRIKYRVAKVTPTKKGLFVTLWKRHGKGPICPFDMTDPVDLFIVSVRFQHRFGQFIFPKSVLCEKGIVSREGRGGKRAMRVYPPWDVLDSPQAKRTQAWQCPHFCELNDHFTLPIF